MLKKYPKNKTFWYQLAKCFEEESILNKENKKIHSEYKKRAIFAYKKALSLGYLDASENIRMLKHKKRRRSSRVLLSVMIRILSFFMGVFALFIPISLENSEDLTAEIHVNSTRNIKTTHVELNEPFLILRSALFQYVKENGHMPTSLNYLTQDFPRNYLTSIPKEIESNSNLIHNQKNHEGGWIYNPPTGKDLSNYSSSELEEVINGAIKPNNDSCRRVRYCDFSPIKIVISKPSNQLMVVSGPYLLRMFPVALGKNDATPTGIFTIKKKVVNPNFIDTNIKSPYGTRGLELSDPRYAIHGTYDNQSIGKDVSHGCIRLFNFDIELLYGLIPLQTEVEIINTPAKEYLMTLSTRIIQKQKEITTELPSKNKEDNTPVAKEKNVNKNEDKSAKPSPPITSEQCECGPLESGNGDGDSPPNESDPDTKYNWAN